MTIARLLNQSPEFDTGGPQEPLMPSNTPPEPIRTLAHGDRNHEVELNGRDATAAIAEAFAVFVQKVGR